MHQANIKSTHRHTGRATWSWLECGKTKCQRGKWSWFCCVGSSCEGLNNGCHSNAHFAWISTLATALSLCGFKESNSAKLWTSKIWYTWILSLIFVWSKRWMRLRPMLDQYIRKCLVSIINIDNGITKHTRGYQNCNTCQVLMFSGYVKVRDYFKSPVIMRSRPFQTILTLAWCYLGMKVIARYTGSTLFCRIINKSLKSGGRHFQKK